MQPKSARHDFASDNTAGICPEAWTALSEANADAAASYGEDKWTEQLCDRVREIFKIDCGVYLVGTGTAANALSLAQLCHSFHSVVCHQLAHLHTDECGAVEFFSKGSKLLTVAGDNGKIDLKRVDQVLATHRDLHSHKPRAISITQATEAGTLYQPDEISKIAQFARNRGMLLHMDGARFANAVAALKCEPADLTWQLGVDVLSFGGTKNGLAAGELVVFFRKELAEEFDYRVKQGGQLVSKMRFLAAPWIGLLTNDTWLRNARHANNMASRLAERLGREAALHAFFPVEANAVFVALDDKTARGLQDRGWHFYRQIEPNVYRLMCSWATRSEDVDDFLEDIKGVRS